MQGELKQLTNLALFARIVQTGGISRCAMDIGLERTTVSRRLSELERDLGVKLLDRTPKNIEVTDAGKLCFERCEQLLEIAKEAKSVATNGKPVTSAEPIVVGAPPDIIEHYLGSKLSRFESENPHVKVQCYPTSGWSDGFLSFVDLCIGWQRPTVSNAFARTLAGIQQSVFASPEYIKSYGAPESPQEIRHHTCIVDGGSGKTLIWKFECEFERRGVLIKRRIELSGMLDVRASTIAGLGLCRLPRYLCKQSVEDGRLVELLPDYSAATRPLLLISSRNGVYKPRVTTLRLFLENILETEAL